MTADLRRADYMPSVMCSNLRSLERDMEFYLAHFTHLHIDVCDGHFCPNIAAGPDIANALRAIAPIGMDYHLMVESPEEILRLFDVREGDWVSIQLESLRAPQLLLRRLRDRGARVMLALRPATPVSALEYLWSAIDGVNVMMIEPGYGKQRAQPEMFRKIADVRSEARRRALPDLHIQVDGDVSAENVDRMAAGGADLFVLGTSGIFTGGAIDGEKYSKFEAAHGAVKGV